MNEILIELYVPALSKSFDVFIPAAAKMYEVSALVTSAIEKLADGLFISNGAVLCDRNNGQPLDANATPTTLKLRNGAQLLLI